MNNIKNENGVTLTSLIIYIIAMVIVVGIVATITKYYYGDINNINKEVDVSKEYTKLISYLSEDVNNPYNVIKACDGKSIVFYDFSKATETDEATGYNQYTFQGDSIYFNKTKICGGVKSCEFVQDNTDPKSSFSVNIIFDNGGKEENKNINYSIRRDASIVFPE